MTVESMELLIGMGVLLVLALMVAVRPAPGHDESA